MGSEGTIPDDVRRMMAVAQQAFLEMDAAEGLCSDDEGYHPPDLLLVEHLGDGKGKDKGKTGCARLDAALHRMAAIADQPGWSDDEECNGYTRDGTLGLDHVGGGKAKGKSQTAPVVFEQYKLGHGKGTNKSKSKSTPDSSFATSSSHSKTSKESFGK